MLLRGSISVALGVFLMLAFHVNSATATTVEIQRDASAAVSVGNTTGGSPFSLIACPPGQIAVGIRGSDTGAFGGIAYQVGLVCQTMDVTNKQLTGKTYTTQTHSGNPTNENLCPSGQVLVGLDMRASNDLGYNVLTEARPKCQTLNFGTPGSLSVPVLTGSVTTMNLWFGSASSGFDIGDADCPSGEFIVGFDGRAGMGLDQFNPYCGRISSSAPIVVSPATLSTSAPSASVPITMAISLGGTAPSSTEYRWYRCPTAGSSSSSVPGDCQLISGATSANYTPTADDVGFYVRGSVTATNAFGSVTSVASGVGTIGLPTPVVDLASSSDSGASSSDDLTHVTRPLLNLSSLVVGANVTVTLSNGTETLVCPTFVATSTSGTCDVAGIPESSLEDGVWVVTAQQTVRFTASADGSLSMTIDTQSPSTPTGATLASSSDTGDSSADNLTNDSTPTIDLTGLEVGTRVVVTASKAGSPSVTCVIANVTSSAESCTFNTALADGEWTFSSVQIDAAGNSSPASTEFVAMIDTAAGVSLSSSPPATGTLAIKATSFAVRAVLTDAPEGSSVFSSSDITIGGTSTGWSINPATWRQISSTVYEFVVSANAPSSGTLLLDVPSGSYMDAAGNSATASTQWKSTIVVDPPTNTAPPAITAAAGSLTTLGSTLSSSTGSWTDHGDLDPGTGYKWQICDDAAGNGCEDVSGAMGSTWVPTAAAEGKYVRSVVTRTNVAGSTVQGSNLTGPMTKSPQQVNFSDPADRSFSPVPFAIAPTSTFPSSATSTGLTVRIGSQTPDVCSVSGVEVTMLKAGTCTLTADQPGDGRFNPATQVVQSFVIGKAVDSSVTTTSKSEVEPGESFSLSTARNSVGAVTYLVVSGPCTASGAIITATGTGDCVISTQVAADDRYNSSTATNVTISVRSTDAITLPAISDRMLSAGNITYSGSTLSGRSPSVSAGPAGVCNYSGGVIVAVGSGVCAVSASVTDDGIWSAASATEVFDIIAPPAVPTITSVTTAGADGVSGNSAKLTFTPGALNGSTLVDYSVTATPVGGGAPVMMTCASSPCTIPGLTAGFDYTFEVVTNARALGQSVLSSPSTASTQVTVLAPHPITLTNPGNKTPSDAPFTIATASDVDPTWTPTVASLTPSVCSVSGSVVTLLSEGTCTLQSSHVGGSSGGSLYGYGSAAVSFRVGVASGSAWPTGGDSGQGATTLTPCQMAAVEGRALPGCPLVNPLPDANGGDESVGIGGGNGAPATQGLIQPPAPVRTVVERLSDGRNAKVTVTVRQDKPNAPVRAVVFIVFDPDGKVVARIAVEVPEGQETVVATVPFLEEGYQVRTYTTNEAGVSNKAPIGANVLNQPTTLGKRGDGTPILFGKRIARPVLFDPDSPQLGVRARQTLDRVVRFAERNGGRVFITGFVRNQGGSVRDQKALSNARAEQVAMYLSRRGVDTWIRYNGYGAYRKGQGEPQDRRVEVRWSNDEIPGLRATAANPVYAAESSGS